MAAYTIITIAGFLMMLAAACAWRAIRDGGHCGPRPICHACARSVANPQAEQCSHCRADLTARGARRCRPDDIGDHAHVDLARRQEATSALQALARGDRLLYCKALQQSGDTERVCRNLACSSTLDAKNKNRIEYCGRCGRRLIDDTPTPRQKQLGRVRNKRTELRQFLEVIATGNGTSAERSATAMKSIAKDLFRG